MSIGTAIRTEHEDVDRMHGLRVEMLPLLVLSRVADGGEKSTRELAVEAERFVTFPQFMGHFLPLLHSLESRGWLASRWVMGATISDKRKLYLITDPGRTAYREGLQEFERAIRELRSDETTGWSGPGLERRLG